MPNSTSGLRHTRLESKTFGHGASVSIQTSGIIPPGRRILAVELILRATITQPGAGQVVQNAGALYQLLGNVKIGRRVSIDGLGLHLLGWLRLGREKELVAGIAATAAGVFNREIKWELPYMDPTSRSPFDMALPSELFTDPIEITFAPNSIFAATVPAVTGTLDCVVTHDAAQAGIDDDGLPSVVVPSSRVLMSQDFAALEALVEKPGAYLYAIAYRVAQNDEGGVTSTQAATIDTYIDGEVAAKTCKLADLAAAYNTIRAAGSAKRLPATADARAGERLNADPGDAAAAGAGVSTEFVPLIFPPTSYLVSTQVQQAAKSFRTQFTGSLGAYKVAYELFEPLSEANASQAARRLGIQGAIDWKTKTHSKGGLSPAMARVFGKFLPQRARRRA